MSKKSNLIKKGNYTPLVFSGWPLEKLQTCNILDRHSRFQRDTHIEQDNQFYKDIKTSN